VHRLEIVGTQGTLRWDNADGVLHFYRMPQPFGEWSVNPPAPVVKKYSPPEGFERNMMFMEQMKHFLAVVRGTSEPDCTLHDGVRALEMAMMARVRAF